MLHQFLADNRVVLIERCQFKARRRGGSDLSDGKFEYGIPIFLDQLIRTLKTEQSAGTVAGQAISGPVGGPSETSELGMSATRHGRELSQHGYTIEQVVHDYGDLCQAITGLAFELDAPIKTDEFKTLNRCLDNGIADAVTEFAYQRDLLNSDREGQALNQRLGFLAHELRNHLNTATLAVGLLKSGTVGFSGATGAVLDRSLIGLRSIVDRSLAEVRLSAGLPVRHQLISVADFIGAVKASASLEAQARGCEFSVPAVDHSLAVEVDQDLLFSAVGNLLQNAFKFTKHGSKVILSARAEGDRVRIEVKDHCGGLPPGNKEDLFLPFKQKGVDKSGVGLGLSICRNSVQANNGILSVRDIPGSGCVFSIDLPLRSLP